MALRSMDLRVSGSRYFRAINSLEEAYRQGQRTAFLCHSHKDQDLALGLESMLRASGWNIYIDWKDATLPDVPDQTTAQRIQEKIKRVDFFLFLATENSMASRWCPWEIGYADGIKPLERILIVPTTDDHRTFGNEYLGLYRHIDTTFSGGLVYRRPNEFIGFSVGLM